jgi:hypothetical protein
MQTHGKYKLDMRKYVVSTITFFLLFSTTIKADGVRASVDTQEVVKGSSVRLSITAQGATAAFPNILSVEDARVTSTSTSQSSSVSITSSGMKSVKETTHTYTFFPQHDMKIPPYRILMSGKSYRTQPINIKVLPSNVPTSTNGNYHIALKSDKTIVSVGESFVVKILLTIKATMGKVEVSNYVPPSSGDFFMKQMGKQKEYKNGRSTVLEMSYVATAKQEGNFTISSAKAQLGVEDRSRQNIFRRYGVKWIPLVSNTLNIKVNAQVKESDLVGDFGLTQNVDALSVKVNKPVNLTVRIEGKGNLEDFVFPKYEIDGVTIYSDEAKIESHLEGETLVSAYVKNFAFIGEESFVIPKRSISVYNPKSKSITTLEVKQYDVTIQKKKAIAATLEPKKAQGAVHTNLKKEVLKNSDIKDNSEAKTSNWFMLVFAFLLGAFLMYTSRWLPSFKKEINPYKEAEALKILYAHISDGSEIEEMVHKLYARKNGDKSVVINKKELKEMVERFR